MTFTHSYIYIYIYIYIYNLLILKEDQIKIASNLGFPHGASVKEFAGHCRRHKRCRFDPWVGKIPGGGHVFLPEDSHGQRNLVGYGPQGHKQSDMIEATQYAHMKQEIQLQKPELIDPGVTGGLDLDYTSIWVQLVQELGKLVDIKSQSTQPHQQPADL